MSFPLYSVIYANGFVRLTTTADDSTLKTHGLSYCDAMSQQHESKVIALVLIGEAEHKGSMT